MEFAFRCPPPPPVTSSGIPWNECIPETGIPRSSYSTTWLSWFDYSRLSPLRGETFPGAVSFRFFSQSCLKKRSTSNLFVRIIIIIVYFYIGIFNQLWKIWAKSRTSQRSLNNKIDSIYPKYLPSNRNYSRTRFLHFSSSPLFPSASLLELKRTQSQPSLYLIALSLSSKRRVSRVWSRRLPAFSRFICFGRARARLHPSVRKHRRVPATCPRAVALLRLWNRRSFPRYWNGRLSRE